MDLQTPLVNTVVNTARIQYIAIAGSILLLLFIIELTRKGAIRIPYSLLWLVLSALFLAISVWRDLLENCAVIFGVAYAPAALFLFLLVGIIGILIHFSVVLSKLSERTRVLVQELSIMKLEIKNTGSDSSGTNNVYLPETTPSPTHEQNSDNHSSIQ